MILFEDLKKIVILGYLTDEMIAKLMPVIRLSSFSAREFIFSELDPADNFFMVKRGKVLLEQRVSDKITVSLGAVKPGFSFGWSTMLGGEHYTSDAVCAEDCEVFTIKGQKFVAVLDQDPHMGYLVMQRLLHVVKKRLDLRTEQFLRVLKHHPDLLPLIESSAVN